MKSVHDKNHGRNTQKTEDWKYWTKIFLGLLLPANTVGHARFSVADHGAARISPILPSTHFLYLDWPLSVRNLSLFYQLTPSKEACLAGELMALGAGQGWRSRQILWNLGGWTAPEGLYF